MLSLAVLYYFIFFKQKTVSNVNYSPYYGKLLVAPFVSGIPPELSRLGGKAVIKLLV